MSRSPAVLRSTVLLGTLGVVIAIAWVVFTGFASLLPRASPGYTILLVAITAFNVFVRFLRWHFLLRRVNVRIPTRPSLSIYLGSLAAIATPAYAGEIVRSVLVKRRFDAPMSRTLPVIAAERGLDVFALAGIGAATAGRGAIGALAFAGFAAIVILLGFTAAVARRRFLPTSAIGQLLRGPVLATAGGLSLMAWLPASCLVGLSAASLGASVPMFAGIQIFSRATLLGGLSLMPAGVGVTGSAAILGLRAFGMDLATSVSVVTLMRLVTVGFALTVGVPFLLVAIGRAKTAPAEDSREHFDEIADVYDEQLSPHIRELLVARKADLIHGRLAKSPRRLTLGLDLGCGQGHHCLALEQLGYRVVGVDPSLRSLRNARRGGARVASASGLQLPFPDRLFDFVFAIGVLHHLPDAAARQAVFQEIRRVLRPDGRLLIHETNPRNPIFRFYMGYLFPIIRRIDEGTEEWLDPVGQEIGGMTRVSTDYATFLPDFGPRPLLPLFIRVERRLEGSRWRGWAAHYLAVFSPVEAGTDPAGTRIL